MPIEEEEEEEEKVEICLTHNQAFDFYLKPHRPAGFHNRNTTRFVGSNGRHFAWAHCNAEECKASNAPRRRPMPVVQASILRSVSSVVVLKRSDLLRE